MRTTCVVVAGALLLAGLVIGSDADAGGSAAAFQAEAPGDLGSINHNGYYLWNGDTVNSHNVVADLGVSSATSMSVNVRGFTQSGGVHELSFTTCQIKARGLSNGSTTSGAPLSTSNDVEGFYNLPLSISGLATGQQYSFELECNLGQLVSGHAGEQIWAWS